MIRRLLMLSVISMVLMGMNGLPMAEEGVQPGKTFIWLVQTTSASTVSIAQSIQDYIMKVRSIGAALNQIADDPIPPGLTAIQTSAFVKYNTWLKTKSSQLYALASKWATSPPSTQTSQKTIMGVTQTTTLDPISIMNIEFMKVSKQIIYESTQMVQKSPVLKPRHDAVLSLLQSSSGTISTADILQKMHEDQMNIIKNLK